MWFLTIDPFVRIPVFIAKLSERQYCWRVFEDFHSQEYFLFFDIHNCLFMRLHFSIGGYDYRRTTRFRQGIHFSTALLKSFLLIMCIDAPESTTNSLSSGLRVDGSRHLFSENEKNVALSCSFNFNTLLASFQAASRAPCSCHSVSSCDRSSNFGATWANVSERKILVSNFSVTRNSLCEFHTLDWFRHVCALPENRLRRRHVLKYTTQLSCIR